MTNMINKVDPKLMIRYFHTILHEALQYENEVAIQEYLDREFKDQKDLYCRFIGFCKLELKENILSNITDGIMDSTKAERLIDFYSALSITGVILGREHAEKEAESIYNKQIA